MSNCLIAFIFGLILGGIVGAIGMALLSVSSFASREEDYMNKIHDLYRLLEAMKKERDK